MEIGKFNVTINAGILIISTKNSDVLFSDVVDIKSIMEKSTGKKYDYVIYANALGYYSGYDFESNEHVYCGSLSTPRNLEKMKAHISNKSKPDDE